MRWQQSELLNGGGRWRPLVCYKKNDSWWVAEWHLRSGFVKRNDKTHKVSNDCPLGWQEFYVREKLASEECGVVCVCVCVWICVCAEFIFVYVCLCMCAYSVCVLCVCTCVSVFFVRVWTSARPPTPVVVRRLTGFASILSAPSLCADLPPSGHNGH